jgi:DNA-directed RNA polymerase subunit RPC12/RpoP
MKGSELAWVMDYPIACGNCGKEFLERVARLVNVTEIACPECSVVLDLNTKEWPALRSALKELYVGKLTIEASVKKL